MKTARCLTIALALVTLSSPAFAVPISIMVGDNDGYGFGVPDNGTAVWPGPGFSGENYDGRSLAEQAATNGARITDVYSALFPGSGPNPVQTGTVLFPLPNLMLSGTLTIDMGDFQSTQFGAILANINGVALPFAFQDGFQATVVRSFVLTPAMVSSANFAGQVILNLDHTGSSDFIAFDYFKLDAEVVPEPGTLLLLGSGLTALAMRRRRRNS